MIFVRGGISALSKMTGFSRSTIHSGVKEIKAKKIKKYIAETNRVRRAGGGRKQLIEIDVQLKKDLEKLIDPTTRGNPMNPLKWTSKSTYNLANELQEYIYPPKQI